MGYAVPLRAEVTHRTDATQGEAGGEEGVKARGRIYQKRTERALPFGEAKQRVLALHDQGISTKRIAHLLDIPYSTVRNSLVALGFKPINHNEWVRKNDIWKK
jgi:DNA-binding NarL/FixJ family response regulator